MQLFFSFLVISRDDLFSYNERNNKHIQFVYRRLKILLDSVSGIKFRLNEYLIKARISRHQYTLKIVYKYIIETMP